MTKSYKIKSVSKKSIYIKHHRETSNALNASVRCEQKRLQRLSETVPASNRISQAVNSRPMDQPHRKPIGHRSWAYGTVWPGAVGWWIGDVVAMWHLWLVGTIPRGMDTVDHAGSWIPTCRACARLAQESRYGGIATNLGQICGYHKVSNRIIRCMHL